MRTGDIVEVVNYGRHYSSYSDWAKKVGTTKWVSGWGDFANGAVGTVVATAPHETEAKILCLVDLGEHEIIISEDGLELREEVTKITNFKVGDKVRQKVSCSGAVAGKEYILIEDSNGKLKTAGGCTCEAKWELISPKNNMANLTQLAKKLFDADTKALVKAGFLNENLSLTEIGKDFIFAQYLSDNKKVLAEEARKLIKEEE